MPKNLAIAEGIYSALQDKVDQSDEFASVEEYVNFILEQVVKKIEAANKGKDNIDQDEEIRSRLRSLGYSE